MDAIDALLDEQVAYYRARAPEYDEVTGEARAGAGPASPR